MTFTASNQLYQLERHGHYHVTGQVVSGRDDGRDYPVYRHDRGRFYLSRAVIGSTESWVISNLPGVLDGLAVVLSGVGQQQCPDQSTTMLLNTAFDGFEAQTPGSWSLTCDKGERERKTLNSRVGLGLCISVVRM